MEKTTLIRREEFLNSLAKLVGESCLEPIILEPIFEKALANIRGEIRRQFEAESSAYKEFVKQSECNN